MEIKERRVGIYLDGSPFCLELRLGRARQNSDIEFLALEQSIYNVSSYNAWETVSELQVLQAEQ